MKQRIHIIVGGISYLVLSYIVLYYPLGYNLESTLLYLSYIGAAITPIVAMFGLTRWDMRFKNGIIKRLLNFTEIYKSSMSNVMRIPEGKNSFSILEERYHTMSEMYNDLNEVIADLKSFYITKTKSVKTKSTIDDMFKDIRKHIADWLITVEMVLKERIAQENSIRRNAKLIWQLTDDGKSITIDKNKEFDEIEYEKEVKEKIDNLNIRTICEDTGIENGFNIIFDFSNGGKRRTEEVERIANRLINGILSL